MEVARAEEAQPLSADPPNKETEVAEIAPEFLIKHPLQNVWTLWFYESVKGMRWGDNIREITSVDTVEDFWGVYNHIKQVSELKQGCDYSFFKQGIRPMWEDKANKNGGRWLILVDKKQRFSDLDKMWLNVCLCLIGESFENADEIKGAVVQVRKPQDKIAIWTGDWTKEAVVKDIGCKLKECIELGPRQNIVYQSHNDIQKGGSNIKTTYTV